MENGAGYEVINWTSMCEFCEVARYIAVHIVYDFCNIRKITISANSFGTGGAEIRNV
jgi:hypothetical protein